MKKIITLSVFIILILTQSCKKDNECEDVLCFTPPSPFEFELVDKFTGENLFTNGTYTPNQIKVINLDDQSNVDFRFINENDYNIIMIHTIGWKTETINYSINVLNESIFELYVNAERLNGGCCDYTKYEEIRIENANFQKIENSGVYKILV